MIRVNSRPFAVGGQSGSDLRSLMLKFRIRVHPVLSVVNLPEQ